MKYLIILLLLTRPVQILSQQYVLTYDSKGNRTGLRITGNIPQPSITGQAIVCSGDSVTWQASGGDRYLWSNGSTANPVTLAGLQTGNIQLTAFNVYGCHKTLDRQLTVLPVPEGYSIEGDSIVAAGSTTLYQTQIIPGVIYDWSLGNTQNQLIGIPVSQVQVRWSVIPGTDSIRLVERFSATGCTGKAIYKRVRITAPQELNVQVFPNPSRGPVSIHISNNTTEPVHVSVFNSIGQQLKKLMFSGSYLYTIRSSEYWFPSSGLYYLYVQTGTITKMVKFVIQ